MHTKVSTNATNHQWLSGQIPEDEPKQETDDYGGKYFEERKVLRRDWKTPWEICQQLVEDQSLTIKKSWVMMMHQTDKEHEE